MSFRIIICLIIILINYIVYRAMHRTVIVFLSPTRWRPILNDVRAVILLFNLPLLFLFQRKSGLLYSASPEALRIIFFPTSVWLATLMLFLILGGPICIVSFLINILGRVINKTTKRAISSPISQPASPANPHILSRRNFLAGSAGLLVPGIFAVTGYEAFDSMNKIDIPPERSIQIPHLPKSLEGLKVVQISDLHVGPYLGEKVLRHVVKLVNELAPDLVFITGDVIDRSLSDLPEAVRGLTGIHCTLGTYSVLGNHDISSDAYSRSGNLYGGTNIVQGLDSIGIQTLRNELIYLGSGRDRLALLGLDWFARPGDQRFYSYRQSETHSQLHRMMEQIDPETPTVLLAHHPDTFGDAASLGIGFTLAGHTHGGQVVLANIGGVPIGIGPLRFRYVSGFYQVNDSSLYVNRGIGYFGVPIRTNCHPEISRFRLVVSNNETNNHKSG
ncbi:MAG: metallophosphoesterase [Smithella sp.]